VPKRKLHKKPAVGSTFKKRFHGKEYTLFVEREGGRLCFRVGGRTYGTPTGAAKSITRYEVNGWAFWKID
jgi:hypothetical protein